MFALWTNADGSITVEKASVESAGIFSIPNVPAGYYWLQIGSEAFWTNTSTFDAGQDIAGGPVPLIGDQPGTQFDLTLSGLASVPEPTEVRFLPAVSSNLPEFDFFDNSNSTSLTAQIGFAPGFDIDWTQVNTAFLLQWVPETVGSLNNLVALGPSLTATNLSLVNGGTNTVTATLQPGPQASIDLTVPGSQWAPLLSGANVAPAVPTPLSSALNVSAQMYVTQGLPSGSGPLLTTQGGLGGSGFVGTFVLASPLSLVSTSNASGFGLDQLIGCNPMAFISETPTVFQPAITADQNFGTVQYADPFPSGWTRTLSLCQESTVSIPIPNSVGPTNATFLIVDSATVTPSNAPLAPVVLPVQNPTIDSLSFFGAGGTITSTSNILTLAWSAPSGPVPFGYTVRVYVQSGTAGTATYVGTGSAFSTAATSITLPPLAGGNAYVFAITADADSTANMQASPFRSSLPTGYATVVSAPVMISPDAMMPAIHGDRSVIARFSEPQPKASAKAANRRR